jgi:hypothetical protein
VTIYEPDGTVVEVLPSPGDHPVSADLCFGGEDCARGSRSTMARPCEPGI